MDVLAGALACGVIIAGTGGMLAHPTDDDGNGKRTRMRTLKDATQLGQVHKAMVVFAHDNDEAMPRPGLIDRHPTDVGGRKMNVPGRGEEDLAANTTANLYSMLITMRYFTPELVVSPVERNPKVAADKDFNYDAYNPAEDTYWDDAFTANLSDGSNASYAHLVMSGERMHMHWKNTLDAQFIVLGNRGPAAGEPDGRSHTCGPHGTWAGNVMFADNHSEFISTFTPASLKPRHGSTQPDNIFATEAGPGGDDCILSFTRGFDDEDKPLLQHD